MSDFTVGVVYTTRDWRPAWQRYVRDHVVGVALRLVRDSRMALEEHLDVLIVDDDTSFLTPSFVAELRQRGVRTVGVYDPGEGDGPGETFLQRVGMDRVVASDIEPEDLLELLDELRPAHGLDDAFEEVVAGLDFNEPGTAASRLIAVGGPPGSGATEVAVALADVASKRHRTILVDVDEVAPGIVRRLQLGLHPHLLTALDQLRGTMLQPEGEGRSHPLEGSLARAAPGSRTNLGFDVLAGLANRRDWNLVRADEVLALMEELAGRWSCVVANLGPHLEDLSDYVDRFAASRAVAGHADRLVAVCEASPRGLVRFLDWMVDVAELGSQQRVDVAVNRTPASRYRQGEFEQQLHDHAGTRLASVSFLPEDRAVARASWDGVLVGRSPFRKAVGRLGKIVLPERHRRRLLARH
ncbi:MAG TPA: hypothetical protein VM142_11210 [Acidimicrobiales bacterium]|nr:hypothetical protein [Acidimicrobiales bacterium]